MGINPSDGLIKITKCSLCQLCPFRYQHLFVITVLSQNALSSYLLIKRHTEFFFSFYSILEVVVYQTASHWVKGQRAPNFSYSILQNLECHRCHATEVAVIKCYFKWSKYSCDLILEPVFVYLIHDI